MQLSTVIDITVHFMSALIAAWLSTYGPDLAYGIKISKPNLPTWHPQIL